MVVARVPEVDELDTIDGGTADVAVEGFVFDAKNDIV